MARMKDWIIDYAESHGLCACCMLPALECRSGSAGMIGMSSRDLNAAFEQDMRARAAAMASAAPLPDAKPAPSR